MVNFYQIDNLIKFLGLDLINYCLGRDLSEPLENISNEQEAVIKTLSKGATDLSAGYFEGTNNISFREWLRMTIIHSRMEGVSTLNHLRNLSNAQLPPVESDDLLAQSLEDFAHHSYPSLLVNEIPSTLFDVEHCFFDAFWGEEELAQTLFPGVHPGSSPTETLTPLTFNTGSGGGVTLAQIPNLLIEFAWDLSLLSNNISIESFLSNITVSVSLFRELIITGSTHVPVLCGLENVDLDENFTREFAGFGELRNSTESDSIIFTPGLSGFGSRVKHSYPAVFQKTFKLEILDRKLEKLDRKYWDRFDSDYEKYVLDPLEKLNLGIMLSNHSSEPMAFEHMHTCILNPLHRPTSSWKTSRNASCKAVKIDDLDLHNVDHWLNQITQISLEPAKIPIRRIIQAYTLKRNTTDGFIDIVIACESLFGSGQGELTFRISAAMSKLIETDPSKRMILKQEISKLYSDRSKIVHGAKEFSSSQCREKRDKLYHHLISCMRILFSDRVDLLAEKNRSQFILLE